MNIEQAICPCCNEVIRVNVPAGREIEDVFIATDIFIPFRKKFDQRLLCPHCAIEVFIRFSPAASQVFGRERGRLFR